jgi:hypothetical protein
MAPDHNKCVKADNCVQCHKEHRGDMLLARPSDRHCTACHAHLDQMRDEGRRAKEMQSRPSPVLNVASFADHPEFALWRMDKPTDSGNIDFSHQKHLRLELESTTNGVLREAIRKLDEMQCAYCHKLDSAGKYMAPIQFDKHCQACHPLLLPLKVDAIPEPLMPTVLDFLRTPIQHPQRGQTAWNVRAAAKERYLQFAQSNAAVLKLPLATLDEFRLLPGQARRAEPATHGQIEWVNEQWRQAESLWFDKQAGCAHCHTEVSAKRLRQEGIPDFGQPHIPERWFEHSVFDHHAHRMLECTSCHENAPTSTNRKDVLMPKLSDCQSCHQKKAGFARADCNECHRFHTGQATNWKAGLTIENLRGQ